MNLPEINGIIYSWESKLSDRRRKCIHYRSIRNFLAHMDEITDDRDREHIIALLNEYVGEVVAGDYYFENKRSMELATNYMTPLSIYFRKYSHFALLLRFRIVLSIGIIGDGVLYFTHASDKFWNIPIVTIGLFIYYLLLKIFKQARGRMYGYQY